MCQGKGTQDSLLTTKVERRLVESLLLPQIVPGGSTGANCMKCIKHKMREEHVYKRG